MAILVVEHNSHQVFDVELPSSEIGLAVIAAITDPSNSSCASPFSSPSGPALSTSTVAPVASLTSRLIGIYSTCPYN